MHENGTVNFYSDFHDKSFDNNVHDLCIKSPWIWQGNHVTQENDKTKFDKLFNSKYDPLLDKKVEFALDSEMNYAQNDEKYEDAFQKSVLSTFEETLISPIESTYSKMTDSMS